MSTFKQHSKKAGVSVDILENAYFFEINGTSRPMYQKIQAIQTVTGCNKEEASKALSYVWDNLIVEI